MRTLICLLKQPSETYKAFNDRLADACAVMRPSGARCALVGAQPKVDLIAVDDEESPVRVAVCPLDASNDAEAARTQDRLARVLAAAAGKPVFTADTDPPLVTVCMWPLENPSEVTGADDGADDSGDAEEAESGDEEGASEGDATPAPVAPAPAAPAPSSATTTPTGRPPFGFRRRGGRLEEDADEADIVRTVLDAYDSGITDDRIMSELMDAHGEWVREHWQPKEIPRHVRRIIEKVAFYRRKLEPEAR
jgi:hypothetical protein